MIHFIQATLLFHAIAAMLIVAFAAVEGVSSGRRWVLR